jgi:hypothetical protein
VEIMERWIPDFKAAALGVQVGVNWLQVNHSLVANRETEWKDDNAGKSLVYNTQTGKTRAVTINDRIVSTPTECACYVMQQLNIAGTARPCVLRLRSEQQHRRIRSSARCWFPPDWVPDCFF